MKETSNYSFPFLKVVLASVLSFFLFSGNVSAQPSVKGRVTDQNGQPLPGVSVIVAGTTNGTMTGSDGSYVISVAKGQTLEFQCLGMTSFRKLCDGAVQVLNVTLKEDTAYLDEVVVVGYGTSKKSSLTGAVSAIKGDEVLKAPASNVSQILAGRLPGISSVQESGEPGQDQASLRLRGSIYGIAYVVDGFPVSDINDINPNDIESISVLKDGASAAVYGLKGAGGVMIITTKSGRDLDRPIIGFRIETNVTTPTRLPKFVDGARYMELFNEAVTNQGTGDVLFSKERIEGTRKRLNPYVYPDVNWYDEIFRNHAFNQKVNFNIRGGTGKITYFMNLTVNHETGMLRDRSKDFFSFSNGINVMKYAFQNNIDFHMSKSSTISLHLNAQVNDITAPAINNNDTSPAGQMNRIYSSIMDCNPVDFPVYFPAGEEKWIKWGAFSGGNDQGATNPLAQATRGYGTSFASTVIANLDFEQKLDVLTKGLRFKAMLSFKNWSKTTTNRSQGVNRYSLEGYTVNPDGTYDLKVAPIGTPGKPVLSTNRIMEGDHRIYFQTFLDWNRTFGKHSASAMLLFNMDELSFNSGGDLISSLPRRKVGYAARLSYDYDHRYLLEFNAGYNGSENFAKGHRYGFFPSVALGWNVSSEKFWAPVKPVISRLKLRGSYGLVGNDQIGGTRFIYLADVNLEASPWFTTGYGTGQTQSLRGPTYNRFQNNDITWEIGRKVNAGVEMELFGSLSLTLEAFREIRSNIFQQKLSIPNYLGTANTVIYGNLAKVKNYGFDISAEFGKYFAKDFYVQFLGTFTYARNKVLEYDEAPGTRPANSRIGHPVNTIYGFVSDGLYIDQADLDRSPESTLGNIAIAPGDIKYIDQPDKNGKLDGKITTDDVVAMGYPTVPEIVYGFGPTMTYRNVDFSFFLQGAARTSLMMSGFHPFGAQYNRNVLQFVADDHWSPTNQNIRAAYPRLTKYENNHNSRASDFWLRDASFIKLKNVEVGWKIRNVRIYANAINVLTFSRFKHWDPEMGGGAGMQYPTQRTFNLGLQVTFK